MNIIDGKSTNAFQTIQTFQMNPPNKGLKFKDIDNYNDLVDFGEGSASWRIESHERSIDFTR